MKIKDIVEARMSAAVKLQRAFEREQSKSTASKQRADQAKANFEKEWKAKQEKEKQGVEEGNSGVLDKQGLQGYHLEIKHGYLKQKNEDAADVDKNTPKKNLRAFRL